MKKKLLALAVAAVLPISAAQAGVTIYGKIHASIDYVEPQGWEISRDIGDDLELALKYDPDGAFNVESRASRIGFKGSEDLGNGLKLIWKVESQVDIAGGTNTSGTYWKGRNAYIGLAGGWGTFLYGRHDTPMKMSTGRLDLFSDELADYNATAGFTDIRADDAIAYVSPSWGGFTLAAAVVPDGNYDYAGNIFDEDDIISGRDDNGGDAGYSIAAMYTIGGVYLAGAWEDIGDLYWGSTNERWRLGAGWDISNFFVGVVYENEDLGGSDDIDKYQISGSYAFGNNKVKAMYADYNADFDNSFSDIIDTDGGDSWAIGFDHNFSKRTKIYAQYADSDRALASSNTGRWTDRITDVTYLIGADGFSMGMVHKF